MVDQLCQRAQQDGSGGPQLGAMGEAQATKEALASRCDAQEDLSAIRHTAAPLHEASIDRALRELDGAIVVKLQAFRNRADGSSSARRHPFESEQKLVLLRLDVRGPGGRLAEVQETADDVAKLG